MYPLVRELASDCIPVAVTCRVLKIARQPFYRWLACPVRPAELAEAYRADALFDAHREDPEFGSRLLADEAAESGEEMAWRTAWGHGSNNGWFSAIGESARGKAGTPDPPVHDDLPATVDEAGRVRHDFTAAEPDELWLTDITEHRTAEHVLHLCAVKDSRSNRIVGYCIDSCMTSRLGWPR